MRNDRSIYKRGARLYVPFFVALSMVGCQSIKSDSDSPFIIGYPTPKGPVAFAAGTNNMTECVQVAKAYESCLTRLSKDICDQNYAKPRDACKGGQIVPGTMPTISKDSFTDKGEDGGEKTENTTAGDKKPSSQDKKPTKPTAASAAAAEKNNPKTLGSKSSSSGVIKAPDVEAPNGYAIITCAASLMSQAQRIICSHQDLLNNDYIIQEYFAALGRSAPDARRKKWVDDANIVYTTTLAKCKSKSCIQQTMQSTATRYRLQLP